VTEIAGPVAAIASRVLGSRSCAILRAARAGSAGRELINKRMSSSCFRTWASSVSPMQAANGDAEFSIIDGSGPSGAGDVKESLLGIEGHQDVVTRRCAKIATRSS